MIPTRPAPAGGRWNLYGLLAEPARLRLLALISEGELGVGELAELLTESQPSISRHVASLRSGGLIAERRRGPRCFLRLAEDAGRDPVVIDAVSEGRRLCIDEGRLERVALIVRQRAANPRDRRGLRTEESPPTLAPELPMYVRALSMISVGRELALDVSAGDGGLLDALAPFFKRVVALEHRTAKWDLANSRLRQRGYTNVELLRAELVDREVRQSVGTGASVVFARNLVARSASPAVTVAALAALLLPGGQLIILEEQWSGLANRERSTGSGEEWLFQHGAPLLLAAGLNLSERAEIRNGFCADPERGAAGCQILCSTRPVVERGSAGRSK